jgi:5-methylcytosine-specific restriction enzyme subunit McrC
LHLDVAGRVKLAPDISWWEHGRCCFVGDVKYKPINVPGIKHPDLYQLLSYTVATDLPSGLLIYAAGGPKPRTHEVVMLGKRLEVIALDLDGPPESILEQIAVVAKRVRHQRSAARNDNRRQNLIARHASV